MSGRLCSYPAPIMPLAGWIALLPPVRLFVQGTAVNRFHAGGAPAITNDVGLVEKIGADDAATRDPVSRGVEPVVDLPLDISGPAEQRVGGRGQ
ncbi:hypothetical protein D3C85_1649660 [compost metagenome]